MPDKEAFESFRPGETTRADGGGRGDRGAGRLGPHSHVKAVVEAHEPGGLVVRILGQTGKQAKGFIPAPATGTPKGTDLRKAFSVGKEVEAKVIEFDPKRPLKLSISALGKDQERQAFRQYQNEVKQASKFGTFGDLLRNKGITNSLQAKLEAVDRALARGQCHTAGNVLNAFLNEMEAQRARGVDAGIADRMMAYARDLLLNGLDCGSGSGRAPSGE